MIFTMPTHNVTCALSLHDALPIFPQRLHLPPAARSLSHVPVALVLPGLRAPDRLVRQHSHRQLSAAPRPLPSLRRDRKSTRLNSSHVEISYAVFCLKKKSNDLSLP